MKAMVLKNFNERMLLEEVEDPRPGPYEIVLRVTSCGVCGTDLKIVSGILPPAVVSVPHTPGHEIAGEVAAVGSEVKDIHPGQKGIVYFYVGCRACEMCTTGREQLCYSIKRLGFEMAGGFAEYVKMPAYNFCPYHGDLPDEQMAVLPDAVATVYHAIKTKAQVKIGQDVLIVGIGGLGIHAVQISKLAGARTIAVARRSAPLEMARQYGADITIDTNQQDPLEAVKEITDGRGVDAVIEIVGTKETLKWSLYCLKRAAPLVLVGYQPSKSVPLPTLEMHYNEWTVCGSRVSTKQELLEIIVLTERGLIRPVISSKMAFAEANEAIEGLRRTRDSGRTVLVFD